MKRYVLCQSNRGNYNIYDRKINDTTGYQSTIEACLKSVYRIHERCYNSLEKFMVKTSFNRILVEFDSFETFHSEFPELLI